MLWRCNDEDAIALSKALPEIVPHIVGEGFFVRLVELNKVTARVWRFKEFLPGRHIAMSNPILAAAKRFRLGLAALLSRAKKAPDQLPELHIGCQTRWFVKICFRPQALNGDAIRLR